MIGFRFSDQGRDKLESLILVFLNINICQMFSGINIVNHRYQTPSQTK